MPATTCLTTPESRRVSVVRSEALRALLTRPEPADLRPDAPTPASGRRAEFGLD